MRSRLINRNVTGATGRTSMRLEPELWDALQEMCRRERCDLRDVIRTAERRATAGGRTSAVRVHVLAYFREAATDDGHARAGHGARFPVIIATTPAALPETSLHT